jgi:predicted amidohydrolase
MKLTIGLSQINTVLGNVEANLEKHLAITREARGRASICWSSLNCR